MAVVVGQTFWQSYNLGAPAPGGGNTICLNGGIVWIVAPASSEVTRNWYFRNDAVTTATNCTSATGWFVPNCCQLKNPGYECRTYWDSYSSTYYWSSTEATSYKCAWPVSFTDGTTIEPDKNNTFCVRAFRCVIY